MDYARKVTLGEDHRPERELALEPLTGPALLEAGDPIEYQGQSLVKLDGEALGAEGLGHRQGRLYVENHPDLRVYGRGTSALLSKYWAMRLMPQVQQVLQILLNVICASPWRISEPVLPEWLQDDPAAQKAARRQWRWARWTWSRWTDAGQRYHLRHLIENILTHALIFGFYVGEGSSSRRQIPGEAGQLLVPELPRWRAAWTIEEWIYHGDEVIGLVQRITDTDSWGRSPAAHRVVIPIDRCLHVVHRPAGPSDPEGTSLIRPAYTLLAILQRAYQMQGLSIECDAVGTRKLTQDKDRPLTRGSDGVPGELDDVKAHFENYAGEQLPWVVCPPGSDLGFITDVVADLTPQVRLLEQQALMAMGGSHHLVAAYGDGSRAAKSESERSARDQIDFYAVLVADGIQRYLGSALRLAFPEECALGLEFCPEVTYAQVEERDNLVYLETLERYLNLRPKLTPEDQSKIDELLDLTTPEQNPTPAPGQEGVQLAAQDSWVPPKEVQEAAARGLELRREHGRGGTEVGVARARDLSNGRAVSLDTLRRMDSYFARHEVDKEGEGWADRSDPSAGYIAWLLWGGDAGRAWVRRVLSSLDG